MSPGGARARVEPGEVLEGFLIHASENEPCRLCYRKLPDNDRGGIYVAHEPNTGSEVFVNLIGDRSSDADDPGNGIALGEVFSYVIDVSGDDLTVTIRRDGKADAIKVIDMSGSGFADDWMYFKAGVYNQNNTGEASDYAQATFFQLNVTHD